MAPKRVQNRQLKQKPAAAVQLLNQPRPNQMQKVENAMKSMMKWILATAAGTIAAVCPEIHPRGRLIVGSACSGISAELMALDWLNVKYVACFGCECEEHLRRLSGDMHGYCQMYDDVRSLNYLSSPTCDLFRCRLSMPALQCSWKWPRCFRQVIRTDHDVTGPLAFCSQAKGICA